MKKLLFIPLNSREIEQIGLVVPFLEEDGFELKAIAFREQEGQFLRKKEIKFLNFSDYKTYNAIDILKQERPDIIIADFCGPFMNAFIMAANNLKIPILQIDDGITADFSLQNKNSFFDKMWRIAKTIPKFLFSKEKRNSYLLFYNTFFIINGWSINSISKFFGEFKKFLFPLPTYALGLNIAVLGPFAKRAYLAMGVPDDKIFITGQPRFDNLVNNSFNIQELKKKIGLDSDKKIVLLATQPLLGYLWSRQDWEYFNQTIIETVSEIKQAQLIIKLHPEEDKRIFQEFLNQKKYNIRLFQKESSLYELLACCDTLVTFNSTVALEAMILGKSVVIVNLTNKPDLFPYYVQSQSAILAKNSQQVKEKIEASLFDLKIKKDMQENQKQFLYDQIYFLDGQASKRVFQIIKKISK